jgi:tRNA A37 methylthiotransferase MiaB
MFLCPGFCGETEEEHAASLDLLRSTRYDNAFLFSYSERGKTYASRHLPDDVPDDVKRRRLAEAFEAYRCAAAGCVGPCVLQAD